MKRQLPQEPEREVAVRDAVRYLVNEVIVATTAQHYKELSRRRGAKPFVPFNIVLKDGRRFEIVEPFSFALNKVMVLVIPPGSTSERFLMKDILEIVPGVIEVPEMPSEFFYG